MATKKEKTFEQLLNICELLDLQVRQEKGDFGGGSCVVEAQNLIVLNRRHSVDKRITILAAELSHYDLTEIDMDLAVSNIIEKERQTDPQAEEVTLGTEPGGSSESLQPDTKPGRDDTTLDEEPLP